MKNNLIFIVLIFFLTACSNTNNHAIVVKSKIDKHWLDSVINNSDSSYIKKYKRTDFAKAEFYINKKDSSVCQVMKDSAGMVRQVIIAKNDVRKHFFQYYANGQLEAYLLLDEYGQYHDSATYYHEDGTVESSGWYRHGLKYGEWENYDTKRNKLTTKIYDSNGQIKE
ncbi:MAG: hypothetical protein ABIP79_14695 [Chitinophagaceae bacterium]